MSDENERYRHFTMPELDEQQAKLAMLGLKRALELALMRVYDLTPPEQAADIDDLRNEMIQEIRNAPPSGVPMRAEPAVIEAVVALITVAFPALPESDDARGG